MSVEYFKNLIKAYDEWKKTPKGQKRLKELDERKLPEIKDLPEGWGIDDSEEGNYYNYWNGESYFEIGVSFHVTAPIQLGGKQEIQVTLRDLEDEDITEGKVRFSMSTEENWEEAVKKANEKAIELMKRFS